MVLFMHSIIIITFLTGLLFAVPVPEKYALDRQSIDKIIGEALAKADKAGIRGKEVTPFLLSEIATISSGNSLETSILFEIEL